MCFVFSLIYISDSKDVTNEPTEFVSDNFQSTDVGQVEEDVRQLVVSEKETTGT